MRTPMGWYVSICRKALPLMLLRMMIYKSLWKNLITGPGKPWAIKHRMKSLREIGYNK